MSESKNNQMRSEQKKLLEIALLLIETGSDE